MRRRSSWRAACRLRRWVGDGAGRCSAACLVAALATRRLHMLHVPQRPSSRPSPPCPQAYCLYRLGRLQDALAALSGVPGDAEAARLQLEAQIQYRLGNCKDAIALYSQLFRAHAGEAQDVRPNVLAAYVAGGRGGEVPAVMQAMKVGMGGATAGWWAGRACSTTAARTAPLVLATQGLPPAATPANPNRTTNACTHTLQISARDSFEVAFNAACALLDAGDLPAAQEQLQLAVRVGACVRRVGAHECRGAGTVGGVQRMRRRLLGVPHSGCVGSHSHAHAHHYFCRRGGALRRRFGGGGGGAGAGARHRAAGLCRRAVSPGPACARARVPARPAAAAGQGPACNCLQLRLLQHRRLLVFLTVLLRRSCCHPPYRLQAGARRGGVCLAAAAAAARLG